MLDDGRALHAHFRMTGDWLMDRADDELPRFARATIEFTDGSRVVLEDPRALSTLDLHAAGAPPELGLGPRAERSDADSGVSSAPRSSKKRGPIKPVLLDQRVIAGLGNIYAAESLWHARISPDDTGVVALTRAGARAAGGHSARDRTRDGCAVHGFVGVSAGGVRSRGEAVSARSARRSSASFRQGGRRTTVRRVNAALLNDAEILDPRRRRRRGRSQSQSSHSKPRRRESSSAYHSTAVDRHQRLRRTVRRL